MCCLPIAGSEQLNDKAADQPQARAPQTGAGGKKALAEGCVCRMARPHPQRPEPRRKAAQFINTGRPRLRSPLGRVHSGGLGGTVLQRAPWGRSNPGGTPPLAKGVFLLIWRQGSSVPSQVTRLWPAPRKAARTLSPFPRLASPTHGGFPSPLSPSQRPQPTSTPDALRIRGHAESWHAPFLPGHINPGVLTPRGEEGQCLQSPVWGAKCILLHLPGLEF